MKKINKIKNTTLLILLAILIIFDQLTKYLFSKQIIDLGILLLRPVTNTGMSFGLFKGNNTVFIIISIIFIALLILFRKEFLNTKPQLIMILAGATGNLLDRIIHGHVLDFIEFRFFPVFNIADTLISLGVISILFYEIKIMINQKKKTNKKKN